MVHGYGDLCQAITDLAFARAVRVEVDEFRTLNRCLDNAIADSVAEFSYQRDLVREASGTQSRNERLGFLAHELRNVSQGAVPDRSLIGLCNLVDRSLADVRVRAGMPARQQAIPLAGFIAEVKIPAALEAQARGCGLEVKAVDPKLAIYADRELLFAALGNLLQNAFKFTEQNTDVWLHAFASAERVLIEVGDRCGGLAPGEPERMLLPFAQGGTDPSGLGLGLAICRRSVEANGGMLSVRNRPGTGCVFTIDLPRHPMP